MTVKKAIKKQVDALNGEPLTQASLLALEVLKNLARDLLKVADYESIFGDLIEALND